MTREEVQAIDAWCAEHGTTPSKRLDELGIPRWQYYKSRSRYVREDAALSAGEGSGGFIELPCGPRFEPLARTGGRAAKSGPSSSGMSAENAALTLEMQTPRGMALRIHGSLTPSQIAAIIRSANV